MAGPSERSVRRPVVAGVFYPGDPHACRALASQLVGAHRFDAGAFGPRPLGGIVPHAGWVCSGAIAAKTIAALATGGVPELVVVFGAIHTPGPADHAALDVHDAWQTPGDKTTVAPELTARVARERPELFAVDQRLHRDEHAVEVEVPLIRAAWPAAEVWPVEVPADGRAVDIGLEAARLCERSGLHAVFLASSDLTHYGPAYRFTPAGVGESALEWALENDRRLLRVVTDLRPEAVVPEATAGRNACGAGAIAAMLAACRHLGARRAWLLAHANSRQTLAGVAPQPADNAVGYASVVVA